MMFLRMSPIAIVIAAILVGGAGRIDLWALLAYPALVWLAMGTVNTVLLRLQPELVAERMKPPSDRDRKTRLASVPALAAHYALAGLDARFGWSAGALSGAASSVLRLRPRRSPGARGR